MSKNNINHITVNLAYKETKDKFELGLNDTNRLLGKEGWELISNSIESVEMSAYGFKAVIFKNEATKEVHFAIAGTKPNQIWDLIDDALLTFGYAPYKLEMIQKFLNHILEKNPELKDYTWGVSGHSLGAVLAELATGELMSRGVQEIKTTTFDNPGSKPVLENIIKNGQFTGDNEVIIKDIAANCTTYNAKPNFINVTNNQVAKDIYLVLPKEQYKIVPSVAEPKVEENTSSWGVWGFTRNLLNKVGEVAKASSDYLGITKAVNTIMSLPDQIKSHSLSNFDLNDENHVIVKVEEWATECFGSDTKLYLEDDQKNADIMAKVTNPTGKDICVITQEEDDDLNVEVINATRCGYGSFVRATQAVKVDNEPNSDYDINAALALYENNDDEASIDDEDNLNNYTSFKESFLPNINLKSFDTIEEYPSPITGNYYPIETY
jgi:hypothetical protein